MYANCDFEFKLFDTSSSGTPVGSTQTATNVSVSKGLFTARLDFEMNAFTGNVRWLEIRGAVQ